MTQDEEDALVFKGLMVGACISFAFWIVIGCVAWRWWL